MEHLRLPSFAKINLGLHILRKRSDGFHDIESVLQQIDLKDEIELISTEGTDISLICDKEGIPADDTNLCVLAAKHLQESLQVSRGVKIILEKHIPAGAGLGGGSSNAAVVLLGLNKLWKLGLTAGRLQNLASQIGSDVPFFIQGGMALARGRGDLLKEINARNKHCFLIVCPAIHVATKWAYGQLNLNLTMKKKNINLTNLERSGFLDDRFYGGLQNDFEEIVFQIFPVLKKLKQLLDKLNAVCVSMTGTGSALFAVFRDQVEASEAYDTIQIEYPAFIARPIKWGYAQLESDTHHSVVKC